MKLSSATLPAVLAMALSLTSCILESPVTDNPVAPRWSDKKPAEFSYTFTRNCFCEPGTLGPFHVMATADSVLSVYRIGSVQDSSQDSALVTVRVQSYSIDSIEAELSQRLSQHPVKAEVRYDMTYGFPAEVFIDFNYSIADEEYGFTITDFGVVSPRLPD